MEFNLDTWLQIENKLKSQEQLDKEENKIVSYIIQELSLDCYLTKNEIYYRARLYKKEDMQTKNYIRSSKFHGYDAENSMAPKPYQVLESGRFNRKNESVLYIASDKYTTLTELRPGKKSFISIAEIELTENIKLADFTFTESNNKEDNVNQIYKFMTLACFYVVNNDKEKYLVTQYIGQQLRKLGYDGIKYSSSLSPLGNNIMLFDPYKARANSSEVYQTLSTIYFAKEIFNGNEELFPKVIGNNSKEDTESFFQRILV